MNGPHQATGAPSPGGPGASGLTVVIPAFNEAPHVADEIDKVRLVLDRWGGPYEIIVVDDGSTDGTAQRAEAHASRVIRAEVNRGYGASLKTGIGAAQYPWIAITDADGTYPAKHLRELLEAAGPADMVVGARRGAERHVPLLRQPAKWVLRKLASHLSDRKIPDLNSGMRVIRRSLVRKYFYLLPEGFSFTTTITMAALVNGFEVRYLPIEYHKRKGTSKIRPRHALDFLILIVRTAVFFNPLRLFLPLGAVIALFGLAKFGYDVWLGNLSESAVLAFLGALIIWTLGLLADQNARIAHAVRDRNGTVDEH